MSVINIYSICIQNIKLENINHYFLLHLSDPASPCDMNHNLVISFNFTLMIQHRPHYVLVFRVAAGSVCHGKAPHHTS